MDSFNREILLKKIALLRYDAKELRQQAETDRILRYPAKQIASTLADAKRMQGAADELERQVNR